MNIDHERRRLIQENKRNEQIRYYRQQFELRLKEYEGVWDESKYEPTFVNGRLIRGEYEPYRIYEARQGMLGEGLNPFGRYHQYKGDLNKRKLESFKKKAARVNKFPKIWQIQQRWLNQEAKLILGAMKRNIKTTQQSRLPFREYVTQRPDSGWKKSFRIEKLSDSVRLIGPAQNKAISLSQTFEYGGDITWSYAGLYSQSTRTMKSAFGQVIQGNKARRKKAFDSFLSHERKLRTALAKTEKDGCKFDYYQGFMQEATARALRRISSRYKEDYGELVNYYKSRWYEKHKKHVHYPFASKTFKELQGVNAISPSEFRRNMLGGIDALFYYGLLDATKDSLDRFCEEWNRTYELRKQKLTRSLLNRQIRLANTPSPTEKRPVIKPQNKTRYSGGVKPVNWVEHSSIEDLFARYRRGNSFGSGSNIGSIQNSKF